MRFLVEGHADVDVDISCTVSQLYRMLGIDDMSHSIWFLTDIAGVSKRLPITTDAHVHMILSRKGRLLLEQKETPPPRAPSPPPLPPPRPPLFIPSSPPPMRYFKSRSRPRCDWCKDIQGFHWCAADVQARPIRRCAYPIGAAPVTPFIAYCRRIEYSYWASV